MTPLPATPKPVPKKPLEVVVVADTADMGQSQKPQKKNEKGQSPEEYYSYESYSKSESGDDMSEGEKEKREKAIERIQNGQSRSPSRDQPGPSYSLKDQDHLEKDCEERPAEPHEPCTVETSEANRKEKKTQGGCELEKVNNKGGVDARSRKSRRGDANADRRSKQKLSGPTTSQGDCEWERVSVARKDERNTKKNDNQDSDYTRCEQCGKWTKDMNMHMKYSSRCASAGGDEDAMAPCPQCGKRVATVGLEQHMENSCKARPRQARPVRLSRRSRSRKSSGRRCRSSSRTPIRRLQLQEAPWRQRREREHVQEQTSWSSRSRSSFDRRRLPPPPPPPDKNPKEAAAAQEAESGAGAGASSDASSDKRIALMESFFKSIDSIRTL